MTPVQGWVTVVVVLQDPARLAGDLNLPLCYRADLPEGQFHSVAHMRSPHEADGIPISIEFIFVMMAQIASSVVAAVNQALPLRVTAHGWTW